MRITLCGSAKFEKEFKEWNKRLTLAGHIVYSLDVYPSDEKDKNWYSESQKQILDLVQKHKIDNSDAILVLNPEGYIGNSTISEIFYAHRSGKILYRLFPYFENPAMQNDKIWRNVCSCSGCENPLH